MIELDEICESLGQFITEPLLDAARQLLNTLGYISERTLTEQSGNIDSIISNEGLPARLINTQSEQQFRACADKAYLIFQVTGGEINKQDNLFDTGGYDILDTQSFIFIAVALKRKSYTRSQYAQFAREINKRYSMPVVVLFRAKNGDVTFAFMPRRPNRQNNERDVLG